MQATGDHWQSLYNPASALANLSPVSTPIGQRGSCAAVSHRHASPTHVVHH